MKQVNSQEGILKGYRRAFVEYFLTWAQTNPREVALVMRTRGWYSETDKIEDLEHYVRCLVKNIEEEGKIGGDANGYIAYPKCQERVPPWLDPAQQGFFPPQIPIRADAKWMPGETDIMLELLLTGAGPKKVIIGRTAGLLARTFKSISRQWELLLYNEKCRLAYDYIPIRSLRRMRSIEDPMNGLEHELLKRHARDGIPVQVTAKIVCRPLDDVKRLQVRLYARPLSRR